MRAIEIANVIQAVSVIFACLAIVLGINAPGAASLLVRVG
jgi:hypothetical protein